MRSVVAVCSFPPPPHPACSLPLFQAIRHDSASCAPGSNYEEEEEEEEGGREQREREKAGGGKGKEKEGKRKIEMRRESGRVGIGVGRRVVVEIACSSSVCWVPCWFESCLRALLAVILDG